MAVDLNNGYNQAKSKIDAYKATIDTQRNAREISKNNTGDVFEGSKSDRIEQLSGMLDVKQKAQKNVENQFDQLIDVFSTSIPNFNTNGSNTIDFLLREMFNTVNKSDRSFKKTFTEEVIKNSGCTEEVTFNPNQKIYVRLNQIDFRGMLKNDPNESPYNILYESVETPNGFIPYSMNRELYNRIQNEDVSFSDQYGSFYQGLGGDLMDIKYVKEYTENGVTFFGDFLEITLKDRGNGNKVSDFLLDYYGTINLFNFKNLLANIMNEITNFIDISANITDTAKGDESRLSRIIARILGLCFDSNREIDVSGIAKISEIDNIDESFFELSSVDLRQIENELSNIRKGVAEFKDCDNVELPIDTDNIIDFINNLDLENDNGRVDDVMEYLENISNEQGWNNAISPNLNINVSIKTSILKIIPKAIVLAMLTPKSILGLIIGMKLSGSDSVDSITDVNSLLRVFRKFFVEMVSKIGAIFIETIFLLIKKNIKQLVSVLVNEIIRESRNKIFSMVSTIIFLLRNLASLISDYRQCKSIIDQLLNLLNLALSQANVRIPTFALASSSILGGYSPTRAMANVTEELQKLGIPTGDLPDGSPNVAIPAISAELKGNYQEQLENGKTEVFIPPLAVVALGGGTTLPSRGVGKSF